MALHTLRAHILRLIVALSLFLIGFWMLTVLLRPLPLSRDLSTLLTNQTILLSLPGQTTPISAEYIPASLNDHGRSSIFWCGLLALASGGAYIIDKFQTHIWSQLLALDSGARTVPKGEKLKFHMQGVKNLDIRNWAHGTGERDTFMAYFFSALVVGGVSYACTIVGVQSIANDSVAKRLESHLAGSGPANNVTFGSSPLHGSYTLESWTCQIAPLISRSSDAIIASREKQIFGQACRAGRLSHFTLVILLLLAVLMFCTILKPEKFTFYFGGNGEQGNWKAVPLEDNDSEDEDPLAGFGGNAREQWKLDQED